MYVLELAGEDDEYAIAEAHNAATHPEPLASGLATTPAINPDRFRGLAFTHRASELIGHTTPTIPAATDLFTTQPPDRTGTAAVRARNVRGTTTIDTQTAERELGAILTQHGFTIDLENPQHELRALFSDTTCALGWLAAETTRDYGTRAPTTRPFFQPGSIDPLEARAIANLAHARPGRTVLDPMCGTAGILIEAGLLGAHVIGVDVQPKMVHGATRNLKAYLDPPPRVIQGDATRLPLRPTPTTPIHSLVFDAPYGRQSKVTRHAPEPLVTAALTEASRLTTRAVAVTDHPLDPPNLPNAWTLTGHYPRYVHRSLTRHVHVLTATPQ